jgi:hypothetical protein
MSGIGGQPIGSEGGELLEQRARRARAGLQRFQGGERPLLAPLAALRVEQQLGVGRGRRQRFLRRLKRVRREQGAEGAALLLVQSLRCPLGRVASLLLNRVRQLHGLGLKSGDPQAERLVDGSGRRLGAPLHEVARVLVQRGRRVGGQQALQHREDLILSPHLGKR